MILSKFKKVVPVVFGLALLATSAYASTSSTANLYAPASSATGSNVSINGTVKLTAKNNGGYDMNASAMQNLFGPDPARASYTLAPGHSILASKAVPASTYYAKARPSYINHSQGYGWTSGYTTISNP